MAQTAPDIQLRVRGQAVASYVTAPDLDPTLSPRPYLHPVRTLGGTVLTDVLPEDHRWHLGISVAMQDVAGSNLWGGRTYVRDVGYTWRDDHGTIAHVGFSTRTDDRLDEQLHWRDRAGTTLLTEDRTISAAQVPGRADTWRLDVAFALTAPADQDIALGSPATNGRPDGAGYGGFFWRLAPGQPDVYTADGAGEEQTNGSAAPWLVVTGQAYTLIFTGLADGDHWFVRTGIYPGVCAALAWEKPLIVPAGDTLRRHYTILVADGTLPRADVDALLTAV
ncbi:MAG TPA: PmoA family protein [Catenuloplanes sp.]|jgi:hypothetical protein